MLYCKKSLNNTFMAFYFIGEMKTKDLSNKLDTTTTRFIKRM